MNSSNPFCEITVFVISMKEALERRKNVSSQLNARSIDWSYIDAIVGKTFNDFPEIYNRKKRLRYSGFDMSMGEIACFLSHRKAWEKCVAQNKTALILEDDFQMLENFGEALSVALSTEHMWDIFRLHSHHPILTSNVLKYGEFEVFKHLKDPSSSCAYLVTPKAATELLKSSSRIHVPIDDFLERIWEHKLRILAIKPIPISIKFETSTIIDRKKPSMDFLQKISREIYRIPDAIYKIYYRAFKSRL
jgi:glycosyl transferase family 25